MYPDFLNGNNIQIYSHYTSLGSVFTERFNLSFRNFFKRPVFEESDGNRVDILHTITKQYKNLFQSSTKLTPIEASLKKKEGYVYKSFVDRGKKKNQKFE